MTSESYLAEVGSYNAVTIDPYQGACGLSLFRSKIDSKEEIRRYLEDCKKYIDVFQNIEDMNRALQIDVMIYSGLMKLFLFLKSKKGLIQRAALCVLGHIHVC